MKTAGFLYTYSGFCIQFENGYSISVRFGYGYHCGRYNKENELPMFSGDAEIAVRKSGGPLIQLEEDSDTVINNVTPNQVLEIMNKISNPDYDGDYLGGWL